MKQNFQLHFFYGENENEIRSQIWCTLIAQLLLTVLQRKAETKKSFLDSGNQGVKTFDNHAGCI